MRRTFQHPITQESVRLATLQAQDAPIRGSIEQKTQKGTAGWSDPVLQPMRRPVARSNCNAHIRPLTTR